MLQLDCRECSETDKGTSAVILAQKDRKERSRRIIGQQPSEARRAAPGSVEVFSGWLHPGRRVQALNESSSNTETNNWADRGDVFTCIRARLGGNGGSCTRWSKVVHVNCAVAHLASRRSNVHKKPCYFKNARARHPTCVSSRRKKKCPLPYLGPSSPRHPKLCTCGRNVRGVT